MTGDVVPDDVAQLAADVIAAVWSPTRPADPRDVALGRYGVRSGERLARDVRLGLFDDDPEIERLREWAGRVLDGPTGAPTDYVPPPGYRPVTEAEVAELRRRGRGASASLLVVEHDGGLAIEVRGDGLARWALDELRLMRADFDVPGSRRPPIDQNYAGAVLREILAKMVADGYAKDLTGPWVDVAPSTRAEWQGLAETVWEAKEFGHGPDHPVPPAEDDVEEWG